MRWKFSRLLQSLYYIENQHFNHRNMIKILSKLTNIILRKFPLDWNCVGCVCVVLLHSAYYLALSPPRGIKIWHSLLNRSCREQSNEQRDLKKNPEKSGIRVKTGRFLYVVLPRFKERLRDLPANLSVLDKRFDLCTIILLYTYSSTVREIQTK